MDVVTVDECLKLIESGADELKITDAIFAAVYPGWMAQRIPNAGILRGAIAAAIYAAIHATKEVTDVQRR